MDNLSAIKFPRVDSEQKPYSERESLVILEVAAEVDLRLSAAAEIAYCTGRRASAILALRVEDFRIEKVEVLTDKGIELVEVAVLVFHKHRDKAKKRGEVPLTPTARRAVERLLATPVVKKSGFLFPNRQNLFRTAPSKTIKPMRQEQLGRMIHLAEQLAGVPAEEGRAFHGLKHRSTTLQLQEAGNFEIVSKQTGTTPETLRRVYLQNDLAPKTRTVIKLEERRQRRDEQRRSSSGA